MALKVPDLKLGYFSCWLSATPLEPVYTPPSWAPLLARTPFPPVTRVLICCGASSQRKNGITTGELGCESSERDFKEVSPQGLKGRLHKVIQEGHRQKRTKCENGWKWWDDDSNNRSLNIYYGPTTGLSPILTVKVFYLHFTDEKSECERWKSLKYTVYIWQSQLTDIGLLAPCSCWSHHTMLQKKGEQSWACTSQWGFRRQVKAQHEAGMCICTQETVLKTRQDI